MLAASPPLQLITNWSEISDPDTQGIMLTSGTYELSNSVGRIEVKVYGKQKDAMQSYTSQAKFYFEPIFDQPPKELLALLNMIFGKRARVTVKTNPALAFSGEGLLPDETDFEGEDDIVIEYEFTPDEGSAAVQTVAFIDDPRLRNRQSKTHRATVKGVYVSVRASTGTVDCTLKQKNNVLGSGSAGYCALSSPVSNEKRDHSLKVKGASEDNYYILSGTWSVS
jgi:hypothetical protein